MSSGDATRARRLVLGAVLGCWGLATTLAALQPKQAGSALASQESFVPELYLSSANFPLDEVLDELPNRAAWERRLGGSDQAAPVIAFFDRRFGTMTNMLVAEPLIPGPGVGNRVTLGSLAARLGRRVPRVEASVVVELARRFVLERAALVGIDPAQLGPGRAGQAAQHRWDVAFDQQAAGLPVRHGQVLVVLNHGNVVMFGAQNWGNVQSRASAPKLLAEEALAAGFERLGGRSVQDQVVQEPELLWVPYAPREHQRGEAFAGPFGQGVRHYLAWAFSFRRAPEQAVYETLVDAHDGRLLSFKDRHQYLKRQIKGGVYPTTNTEICPDPAHCGTLQPGWPMPFADTGLAAPNQYTNSGGVFDYTGGTVTTTLNGRFVRMRDGCGDLGESSSSPPLDLGGSNGDHDCDAAGASEGNTATARTGFYELNKLIEQARGHLPLNTWLDGQLTARTNLMEWQCNAFWDGTTVSFYPAFESCRNMGEMAGVYDHEWGHGLDDNDTLGTLSSSSEGYADIATIYRQQTSCVGHGFFSVDDWGCGTSSDGAGFNFNESQTGSHCNTDCSGVRDADWARHADGAPDTPLGFVCAHCSASDGPCGRQVHCAGAPVRQAAWDFVTRDLAAPPFGYPSQTAFFLGNKLFYQGSGSIGAWHSCTCGGSSDGCAAESGYMGWLAADDDNGNLADGTPHMTALHAAFNRHAIACAAPTPTNSGCAAGPTAAPTLTVTAGLYQNSLSWTPVAGATRYWVLRSEGLAGCDFGQARLAEVTGTAYLDTAVGGGRTYSYNVVAAGATNACFGRASNCASGAPLGPDFTVSCAPLEPVWEEESRQIACTVGSIDGFADDVALSCANLPPGVTCSFSPGSVSPPANSTLTVTLWPGVPRGPYGFDVRGVSGSTTRAASVAFQVVGYGTDRQSRFDPLLQASRCFNPGRACSTGVGVDGRDTIAGGNEPNQPNTLHDSCADGSSGVYHQAESNDVLRVFTTAPPIMAAGETVTVQARAWVADLTQDRADFYFAPNANTPVWSLIATVAPVANGLQTLSTPFTLPVGGDVAVRVRLRRGGSPAPCGAGPFDDHDDLVFHVVTGDLTATWDPVLQVPKCGTVGRSCDSGPSLLLGRAGLGPEPNQPNTIGDSCADGTSGVFHEDESNDRLKIATNDGSLLAQGKAVTISATIWTFIDGPGPNRLEIYHAPNANAPVWTKVGPTVLPTVGGAQVLSVPFTLPAGPLQAIRARFRYQGVNGACITGTHDDHDDLVFAVSP